MGAFTKTVVIRMHHTDAVGIVFFGRLFDLADEVMEEAMEAHGLSPGEHMKKSTLITPVVHAEADYKKPMFLGSRLTARAFIERFGNTSFHWRFEFLEASGDVAASVKVVQVLIDRRNGRKKEIPDSLRKQLGGLLVEPTAGA